MGEGMHLQNPGAEGGILLQNSRGQGPYLLQTDNEGDGEETGRCAHAYLGRLSPRGYPTGRGGRVTCSCDPSLKGRNEA
jgi:hypothetical protein